jgi:hypothetical protein
MKRTGRYDLAMLLKAWGEIDARRRERDTEAMARNMAERGAHRIVEADR